MNPWIWELQVALNGLEDTVTDEEIKWVVWELGADKVPESGGFPLFFYQ